ncbi:MAG: glutathione S-transferase family protein [Parvularculaceae bacterium]
MSPPPKPTYTLYAAQFSLFSGKARGYLRWKRVKFNEVLSSGEVYRDIILPNIGWPVIPVMQTPDGTFVQDTADIIAHVEAEHPEPSVLPPGPVQQFVTELIHTYADQWLLLPAMHYRWAYDEEWVFGEFGRTFAPNATPAEQAEIGKKRGSKFKAFLPMLGINEQTIPGIESSYEAFLAEFSAHLADHLYVFGERPTLADFALLGPLYAHLYRDPTPGKLMRRIAPKVANWAERTHGDEDVRTLTKSALIDNDKIPETLEPVLRRMMAEQLPTLLATDALLDGWASDQKPGIEVPRALGTVPFEIGGCTGVIAASSFALYRLQAALDALSALNPAARIQANDLLDRIGASALKDFTLSRRLERRNYKLVIGG